jgi:hypothetical protein
MIVTCFPSCCNALALELQATQYIVRSFVRATNVSLLRRYALQRELLQCIATRAATLACIDIHDDGSWWAVVLTALRSKHKEASDNQDSATGRIQRACCLIELIGAFDFLDQLGDTSTTKVHSNHLLHLITLDSNQALAQCLARLYQTKA